MVFVVGFVCSFGWLVGWVFYVSFLVWFGFFGRCVVFFFFVWLFVLNKVGNI